jgi:hypothetical protein
MRRSGFSFNANGERYVNLVAYVDDDLYHLGRFRRRFADLHLLRRVRWMINVTVDDLLFQKILVWANWA